MPTPAPPMSGSKDAVAPTSNAPSAQIAAEGPCTRRIPISDNSGSNEQTTLYASDFPSATCTEICPEIATWCFEMPSPGYTSIQLHAISGNETPGAMALSLRSCCGSVNTQIACEAGEASQGVTLSIAEVPPGVYTIVAQTSNSMPINLSWGAKDALIANSQESCTYDPCQSRYSISGLSGSQIVKAQSPTVPYTFSTCADPDAAYVASYCFSLDQSATIDFFANWQVATYDTTLALSIRRCCGDVLAELYCAAGSASKGSGFQAELGPGFYTVLIEIPFNEDVTLSWSSRTELNKACGDDCSLPTSTPTETETPTPTETETPTPTDTATPTPTESETPVPVDSCLTRRTILGGMGSDTQRTELKWDFERSSCADLKASHAALWCFNLGESAGILFLRARSPEGVDRPITLSLPPVLRERGDGSALHPGNQRRRYLYHHRNASSSRPLYRRCGSARRYEHHTGMV